MSLDINSPRGQKAAADQIRAAKIVFPDGHPMQFKHTATNDCAAIDGVICRGDYMEALAEIKTRDFTYERLSG